MTAPAIRAALERLITMASDELTTPALWAHSRARWDAALAAARAALDAAPEGEPSDEELYDLAELFNGDPVPAMRRALELWGRPAAPPADLPPDYIDEWITNPRDRSLLEVFHKACNAEGGSADEVILRGLKAVLQDGLSRSHRLQQENHRFREPERTILCDILANGTLLPDPDGTRYGIPAAPPAPLEGEVGELVVSEMVRQLRTKAATEKANRCHYSAALLTRAADLLQQDQGSVKSAPSLTIAPAPAVVPVPVSEALIKAECALSDVAEGEPECDDGDPAQWAEQRCAETLAVIRPVMKQHKIRTSEWPPQPLPTYEDQP